MPLDDEQNRETESRRILDRVSKEADSNGFTQLNNRQLGSRGTGPVPEENDPIEVLGTKIGRALGFVITVAIMGWLALYVLGIV